MRTHERRTGSHVALSIDNVPDQAPLALKITVYRLIQEALHNAYRHAGGVGQAVQASGAAGQLEIEVCDEGPGFDATLTADEDNHLGLLGMRERVESLGGLFNIESAPGRGTTVRAWLAMGTREGLYGR